jgi:AAA domain-containing protein
MRALTPSATPPTVPSPATLANPFPLEAVAVFGATLPTSDDITYMGNARSELVSYLSTYPVVSSRHGGAIGLTGPHGSGKTHLLNWLAHKAREHRTIRATVLYAKADSASLFDLYRQLLSQFGRANIVELIDHALVTIAKERVSVAKVTESIGERITDRSDLQKLSQEQNVDREQLGHLLRERMLQTNVPDVIPLTLLQVTSSDDGDEAYRWFAGQEIAAPRLLDIPPRLSAAAVPEAKPEPVSQVAASADPQSGTSPAASGSAIGAAPAVLNAPPAPSQPTRLAEPELAVIDALETLAALHTIAGVPMIVLIDQLEVLLRTADRARAEILNSLLKKLIEHLGRQHAVLFIAGTPEAWKKLPRDVAPRMRTRDPLRVGNLTVPEARLLLKAYTDGGGLPPFPADAVDTVHRLSGGSPREVLRIAYHAFDKTKGAVAGVTVKQLLESAHTSGTVADRYAVALGVIDSVLGEFGRVRQDFDVGAGVSVERMLMRDDDVLVAVLCIRATDKLSEVDSARRASTARSYCASKWPLAKLIAVSIGYSSAEVLDLLGTTVLTLVFNDDTFEGELRSTVAELAARTAARAEPKSDVNVVEVIQQLSSRLAELEARRLQEAEAVRERFHEGANVLARPAQEERALRTRWEILEALDDLSAAMAAVDLTRERQLIHSLLVSNESYVKSEIVDRLGELYLEALAVDRVSVEPSTEAASRRLRRDLEAALRASVRPTTRPRRFLRSPRALITTALVLGGLYVVTASRPRFMFGDPLDLLLDLIKVAAPLALVALLATYLIVLAREQWMLRRFRARVQRLRSAPSYNAARSEMAATNYPQAR